MNRKSFRRLVALAYVMAVSASAPLGAATLSSVTLQNPGFETDNVPANNFVTANPSGWSLSTEGDAAQVGMLDGSPFMPRASQGNQHLYVNTDTGATHPYTATQTLWQTPLTALDSNALYTLTIDVGNRDIGNDGLADVSDASSVVAFFMTLGNTSRDDIARATSTVWQANLSDIANGTYASNRTVTLDTAGMTNRNQDLNVVLFSSTASASFSQSLWDNVRLTVIRRGLFNAGFEQDDVAANQYTPNNPSSWNCRAEANAYELGIIDGSFGIPAASEGSQHVFMNADADAGSAMDATQTLWQVASVTLDPTTRYTVTFDVANRDLENDGIDDAGDALTTVEVFFTLGTDGDDPAKAVGSPWQRLLNQIPNGQYLQDQTVTFSSVGIQDLDRSLNLVVLHRTTSSDSTQSNWDKFRLSATPVASGTSVLIR